MALLETVKVVKRFGGLVAVNKMDFSIEKGEIVSIIGPNGAGKTTFFNTLTGIYHADEGRIDFNGKTLLGLRPDQIAERGIARTFQNIRLFGDLTVLDTVMIGQHSRTRTGLVGSVLHPAGQRAEEAAMRARALEALEFVGLRGKEFAEASYPVTGKGEAQYLRVPR